MVKNLRVFIFFIFTWVLLTGCRKKEFDKYYGRPANLAEPIYQQLQARGDFTHFLSIIDRTPYKKTLSEGGYWTLFAPTNEAFEEFFSENGLQGNDDIDSVLADKIVRYALVYNAYRKKDLANQQNSGGPDTSIAFKRKTAYYDFVRSENTRKIIGSNRNGSFNEDDNNNKYIPYFLESFMSARNLVETDYNAFYPNTPYTGFNVAGAEVIESDIPAENGLINITNRVVLPLPSLEDFLAEDTKYSEFKRLLDKLVSYQSNPSITERYSAVSGSKDSVFVKLYDAGGAGGLAFSPNNENFVEGGTDAQSDGWSIVAPTNEALIAYEKEILKYFGTFDAAPPSVLSELLNAHLWTTSLWLSKLKITPNSEQETATFEAGNIIESKMGSNGIFYGTDKVQEANSFRTVYSKAFLNPAYSLMTRALDADLKFSILNPSGHFTLIMMSNKVLGDYGYSFDEDHNEWVYEAEGGTAQGGSAALSRINRILKTSVLITTKGEMDDLSGEGVVEAWDGEFIRFKNNTLWAGGNADAEEVLHVDSVETSVNGTVYYVDGLLTFSENTLGWHLEKLAAEDSDNFNFFYQYLINSPLWDPDNLALKNLTSGNLYTIFVPTNDAISEAVKNGILPGDADSGNPKFNPEANEDIQTVSDFISYHILDKNTIASDGKKSGEFPTLLKTLNGDLTFISIDNGIDQFSLTSETGNQAHLNFSSSNFLGDRVVIHSIDRVLEFESN